MIFEEKYFWLYQNEIQSFYRNGTIIFIFVGKLHAFKLNCELKDFKVHNDDN